MSTTIAAELHSRLSVSIHEVGLASLALHESSPVWGTFDAQPSIELGRCAGMAPGGQPSVGERRNDLVSAARLGDQNAWAELYRAAYPKLLGYARCRLGGFDEAKDAVAEVMARAVTAIERFDGSDDRFTPWLIGICRNVVVDAQRAKYRFTSEPEIDYVSDSPTPLDYLMADVEHELLRQAFARLSDDDREILELRVIAGLSSEDVAIILDSQPSAVRMAQMRALHKLRVIVEELGHVG